MTTGHRQESSPRDHSQEMSTHWASFETSLGADVLEPIRIKGHEGISEIFEFEIELRASNEHSIPFDKIVGRPASLRLTQPGGHTRHINGVVSQFREGLRRPASTTYKAKLVSPLWMWKHNVQNRIFKDQTVPQIVASVLRGLKVSTKHLHEVYESHYHCIQHGESDCAFVRRLLEEEGISFYHGHEKGDDTLYLFDPSDKTTTHAPVLHGLDPISFNPVNGGQREHATVRTWNMAQAVRPEKHVVRDRHFQLSSTLLDGSSSTAESVRMGKRTIPLVQRGEVYDGLANFAHRVDEVTPQGSQQSDKLDRLHSRKELVATYRAQAEIAESLWVEGSSDAAMMTPGYRMRLTDHEFADGEYLVVRVEHEGTLSSTDTGTGNAYRNTFRCVSDLVPYRPSRSTPAPKIGTQVAQVVCPDGEEIFTDRYGRVQVRYPWQRDDKGNHGTTSWIRVRHPMAGKGFGSQTLPRANHELVVTFVDGDVDQPLGLGCLFNEDNKPPFPLPANRTQSGIKTQTYKGGSDEYSGLVIEDREGVEHLNLHSQRHMTHSAGLDSYHNTGGSHHTNAGRRMVRQVGGIPFTSRNAYMAGKSGSGSGDGSGWEQESPFAWNPSLPGAPGTDSDIVIGHKAEQVLGLFYEIYYGSHNEPCMNPLGVAYALPPLYPAFSGAAALGLSFLGFTSPTVQGNLGIVLATSSSTVYGTCWKVQRGPVIEQKLSFDKPSAWSGINIAITVAATLYMIMDGLNVFLRGLLAHNYTEKATDNPSEASKYGSIEAGLGFLFLEIQFILLAVWLTLEASLTTVKFLKIKVEDWVAISTALATGNPAAVVDAGYKEQTSVYNTLQQDLLVREDSSIMGVALEAEAAAEEATLGIPEYITCDSVWTMSSPIVCLMSNPDLLDELNGITFSAYGPTGSIGLLASTGVHLQAGLPAYIDISGVGETGLIEIDPGPLGTTMIKSGLVEIPCIIIDPATGITITSETMISLVVDETNIEITPAGVEINCGASSITITPAEGIVVTSPAINKVAEADVSEETPEYNEEGANLTVTGIINKV
ncbi:Phage-related baseplate assembly protein [Planctomycetes bacterium Pan216]|uniref:Phage-related baseplate assembly protein n=1 Tax=Kolteria novifilia TaxID=2527975 RepID=A0A518AY44_9BACT|nr:Phage-related baseplate assembly protein [Planctomycetes bacterium Pan216]